jgi:hypothetical protein
MVLKSRDDENANLLKEKEDKEKEEEEKKKSKKQEKREQNLDASQTTVRFTLSDTMKSPMAILTNSNQEEKEKENNQEEANPAQTDHNTEMDFSTFSFTLYICLL